MNEKKGDRPSQRDRLATLILLSIHEALSPEEQEELDQFLKNSPKYKSLYAQMHNEHLRHKLLDGYVNTKGSEKQVYNSFLRANNIHPVRHILSSRRLYVGVAAAIFVLLAGGAAWVYFEGHKSLVDKDALAKATLHSDVMPGGNKATLKLGDGSVLSLSNTPEGIIAHQGEAKIEKTNDSALAYEGTASGKGAGFSINTLSTPRGGQYQVKLSDGTLVWLDAASSLSFPSLFKESQREVNLTGQAFFQVAHRKEPFIVRIGKTYIRDLGTSFNVNAYSDEKAVLTTLVEGSVKVVVGSHQMVLMPGQEAQVDPSGASIQLDNHPNLEEILAWKKGQFIFRHTDLKTGLRQIARWYDVGIEYKEPIDSGLKIIGIANRGDNLSKIVQLLNLLDIKCTIDEEHKKLVILK